MFRDGQYKDLIAKLIEHQDEDVASMAWNLCHDERISPNRYTSFGNSANELGPIECEFTLERALDHYQLKQVRIVQEPEFARREFNENNFHGPNGPLPALDPDTELVRVLCINGLDRVFLDGANDPTDPVPEFADLPSSTRGQAMSEWLNEKLNPLKDPISTLPANKNAFLELLLRRMAIFRRKHCYEPTWATLWEKFEKRNWSDPARWQPLLGVRADRSVDVWLLLLRYRVKEAGLIVRPTQFDSGWYPEHFPSPPAAIVGHPMDLDANAPYVEHLPEYIHQQIDHCPEHIVACRVVPKIPNFQSTSMLPVAQQRHWQILADSYDLSTWPLHNHPFSRLNSQHP